MSLSSSPHASFVLSSFPPTSSGPSPRLGSLKLKNRAPISTPHYVALSSRGCVPHVTPDVMLAHTNIQAMYTGFEDYAENLPSPPHFYAIPELSTSTKSAAAPSEPSSFSPLRRFIALPSSPLLILGPRRHPTIPTPSGNTPTSMQISASVGFRRIDIPSYIKAMLKSVPDIAIGPADIDLGSRGPDQGDEGKRRKGLAAREKPGRRRRDAMVERTSAWMKGAVNTIDSAKSTALWVPILPLEAEVQTSYLEDLEEAAEEGKVGGVVIYENASLEAVPQSMQSLPKFALTEPKGPSELLDTVSLGVDLCAAPFVNNASEAGVALTFAFPAAAQEGEKKALGVDLWDATHAHDVAPFAQSCECFACTKHHRAYVHHLLQAKEMLAWVLLQVHNHWVMDQFLAGVRESIKRGTFDGDVDKWKRMYEPELPEFKGLGPRIRGYQSATQGPAPAKKNKAPYTRLERKAEMPLRPNDRKERLLEGQEARPLSPSANAVDLEEVGFAELYSEADAKKKD